MSLGGGKDKPLDAAVNAAVRRGIHFSIAAGNEDQDACFTSPAASDLSVTVAASDRNDRKAWFSNNGKCVDIFGPGVDILSCGISSKKARATVMGKHSLFTLEFFWL